MRRAITLLLAFMFVAVAACGDDDAGSPDPASLGSCDSIADASIGLLQDTLDYVDSLSAEELATMGSAEETPAALAAIEAQGTALEARATTLGCTGEQMDSLMAARVDRLSSDSVFGQFLIESVRSGEGGYFGG